MSEPLSAAAISHPIVCKLWISFAEPSRASSDSRFHSKSPSSSALVKALIMPTRDKAPMGANKNLRQFFKRKQRRPTDKGPTGRDFTGESGNAAASLGSPVNRESLGRMELKSLELPIVPTMVRRPLYSAPPRIIDLIEEEHGDCSESDLCASIPEYLGILRRGPSDKEKARFEEVCVNNNLVINPSNSLDAVGYRLLRKLVEAELQRGQSEEDADPTMLAFDIERWITSGSFWRGFESFLRILDQQSIIEASSLTDEQAWELLMVIEPLVRADPLLTADHTFSSILTEQERQLLHFSIWQGERVYGLLRCEEHQRPRSRSNSVTSPGKALRALTYSVQPGVTPLEFFFRKLLRSAAAVFQYLVSELSLSDRAKQSSWHLFMAIVERELLYRLLFHRHLFTVIACTIYSVARLFDEDRSFSQIISHLQKDYPSYGDAWFRSIRLCPTTTQRVDIVEFYNSVFLESLRDAIYALRDNTPVTPTKGDASAFPPFPTVIGAHSISRNVRLDVSTCPKGWGESCPSPRYPKLKSPSTCIKILGNLGAKTIHEISTDEGDSDSNQFQPRRRVSRWLDF